VSGRIDALIVGAGVIGCATAFELARRGVAVRVLERSVPGAEASSAAAGLLGAQVETHEAGPLASLCLLGRDRFATWASELASRTGIDIEHRACGVTRVAFSAEEAAVLEHDIEWQLDAGLRVERPSIAELRELEPEISDRAYAAARFPDDARVDPPRLLRAMRIAGERAGAVFSSGAMVRRVLVEDGIATGVEIEGGAELHAGHVVIAAGSWSNLVPGVPVAADTVRPARGQIIELVAKMPPLRGAVFGKRAYLSPRDDGRILIGSTLEFVGFERAVTAGAVRDLLAGAIDLVPSLANAEVSRMWSQFRPYTQNQLPLIGPSSVAGLLLATGHFRNGILLGPVTGEIIADLVTGKTPPIDLSAFRG
jgi:glycine oxidase